jgi:hypothetical protein
MKKIILLLFLSIKLFSQENNLNNPLYAYIGEDMVFTLSLIMNNKLTIKEYDNLLFKLEKYNKDNCIDKNTSDFYKIKLFIHYGNFEAAKELIKNIKCKKIKQKLINTNDCNVCCQYNILFGIIYLNLFQFNESVEYFEKTPSFFYNNLINYLTKYIKQDTPNTVLLRDKINSNLFNMNNSTKLFYDFILNE